MKKNNNKILKKRFMKKKKKYKDVIDTILMSLFMACFCYLFFFGGPISW